MSIIHQNVRSVNNCVDLLINVVQEHSPHFLCLTEHWLTKDQINALRLCDYKLVSSYCRGPSERGGAAIFCRPEIDCRERKDLVALSINNTFECAAVEFKCENVVFVVACVYRTPESNNYNDFLHIFEQMCECLCGESSRIAISGDFNVDLLEKSKDKNKHSFLNLLSTYDLIHTVKEPTRVTKSRKSCLDNIIIDNFVGFSVDVFETHISDHTAQHIKIDTNLITEPNCVFKRNFSQINISAFCEALNLESWETVFSVGDVEM